MNRKEILEVLCLLSALESWGFSSSQKMPAYLIDDLIRIVDGLKNEVLKDTA